MTFNFYRKFGALKGYEIEQLFQRGIRAQWSFDKLQSVAFKAGMSYRRMDMQFDYRRSKAAFYAKTMTSREHSVRFFDKFFEPTRFIHSWTGSQTTEFFRLGRLGMLDTIEEMEDYELIMLDVETEFPEMYG